MDWFRRKSIVKDSPSPNHLQIVQTSGRNDSADSFVRVEPNTVRSASAMSQVSSIAVTADGRETPAPPIAEEDEGEEEVQQGSESKEQEAERVAEAKTSTVSLAPPVQAPIQAEAIASRQSLSPSPLPEPTRQPIAAVDAQPQAVRVSPPRQTPTRSKSHGMPGTATPSLSSQATPAGEDARLRIHTGVLDQSALSSKPPQDIMNEVIRVLMEMGMEVKRENEYRVRCTRVKKKGRGFGSVISMAGGVMGSASLSRVCCS
jgi:protein-serine/threonine kinase